MLRQDNRSHKKLNVVIFICEQTPVFYDSLEYSVYGWVISVHCIVMKSLSLKERLLAFANFY